MYPFTYINSIPCITQETGIEEQKIYSVDKRNSTLQYFIHPEQNLCTFHTPYIPTDTAEFEFESSEDRNHHSHISSVHKTYLQICYSDILPLQILVELVGK